jgi:hypothetical protein
MSGRNHNIAIVLIVLFCLAINFLGCDRRKGLFVNKAELAKRGIHKIADGLDAYFDRFGHYPEDIYKLREKGFLSRFPSNPYQKEGTQMMQVKMGAPVAGDFTYLKIYRERFSDEIMYYILILWGPDGYENEDVLDASYNYEQAHLTEWIDMPDGTPDPYLTIIKGQLRLMPETAVEEKKEEEGK